MSEQAEQKPVEQAALTEGQVLSGGLENVPPPQGAPQELPKPPAQEPVPEAASADPVYETYGQKFSSVNDLKEYTRSLEETIKKNAALQQQPEAPSPAPQSTEFSRSVEDLLWEDPKKALDLHAAQIEQKIDQKRKQEEQLRAQELKFWEDFYVDHKDLKRNDRLVKSILREKWGLYNPLGVEEAKRKLAEESRRWLNEIRQTNSSEEKLSSQTAETLGAGASSPPKVEVPERPKSFMEQLMALKPGGKA